MDTCKDSDWYSEACQLSMIIALEVSSIIGWSKTCLLLTEFYFSVGGASVCRERKNSNRNLERTWPVNSEQPTACSFVGKLQGLYFAYEDTNGEKPFVKYSDDGYWKLIDGEWIPFTEKQITAINRGAAILFSKLSQNLDTSIISFYLEDTSSNF